jgi:hypothetical protein
MAECTPKWAARTRELINVQITHVFTSEEYGDNFAAEIGATHVSIDEGRMSFPISGTEVRKDVSQHWLNLPRIVRQGLFRKIAVIGSESTGTTTLALDLAKDLGAPCAPEAGRTISWGPKCHGSRLFGLLSVDGGSTVELDRLLGGKKRLASGLRYSLPVCDRTEQDLR